MHDCHACNQQYRIGGRHNRRKESRKHNSKQSGGQKSCDEVSDNKIGMSVWQKNFAENSEKCRHGEKQENQHTGYFHCPPNILCCIGGVSALPHISACKSTSAEKKESQNHHIERCKF